MHTFRRMEMNLPYPYTTSTTIQFPKLRSRWSGIEIRKSHEIQRDVQKDLEDMINNDDKNNRVGQNMIPVEHIQREGRFHKESHVVSFTSHLDRRQGEIPCARGTYRVMKVAMTGERTNVREGM